MMIACVFEKRIVHRKMQACDLELELEAETCTMRKNEHEMTSATMLQVVKFVLYKLVESLKRM